METEASGLYRIFIVEDDGVIAGAVARHLESWGYQESVMGWYARDLGYGEEADFWSAVGLLHDVDFEKWPDPRRP